MRRLFDRRSLVLSAALLLTSSVCSGYYYYIHFPGRFGPFTPIPEKFNLAALNNNTVYYFISDQGPSKLAPGDSYQALVSEIQLAARAWNDVGSSALRLRFGGETTVGKPQTTPGIDIIFDDDIPPGLLALGGPMVRADVATGPNNSAFVPILRSVLQVRRDLSEQASYDDSFFLTLVHEFGHTLGLQHTLTSAVMSTGPTRGTTKPHPLAADDIAGVSLLYPTAAFLASTGSVTGQVTLSGAPVNLASVVVLSATGPAISALTNPDGTYRIDGIPPGQYYVYVHPLPPPFAGEVSPANITFPRDDVGGFFPPTPSSGSYDTQFFPGTHSWSQATQITVTAGASTDGINFSVQKRASVPMSAVQTYEFLNDNTVAVKSPPVLPGTSTMYFTGIGTQTSSAPAPGMSMSVVGGSEQVNNGTLKMYSYPYLQVDLVVNSGDSGPRHLAFNLGNDLYVLPSAFFVVHNTAPLITSVAPTKDDNSKTAVLIAGTNLYHDTRILFDGSSGIVQRQNTDGTLLVTPPPATGNYPAGVSALNSDGQTSFMMLGSGTPPPVYTYDSMGTASASLLEAAFPAGTDARVEIDGVNTDFQAGRTTVGFGSSDITVRGVWAVSPTQVLADISINSSAQPDTTTVTVASGLQFFTQPFAFQIQTANPKQIVLHVPILNAATQLAGTPAGGNAIVNISNLPASGWTLTVADKPVTIVNVADGQVTFQVPGGLAPGPALVTLQTTGNDLVYPILMQIDAPPPVIVSATIPSGAGNDAAHPAFPGDTITLVVTGLADPSVITPLSSTKVSVGGVDQPVTSVQASTTQANTTLVQFTLTAAAVATGAQPNVVLSLNTRFAAPFAIFVQKSQ